MNVHEKNDKTVALRLLKQRIGRLQKQRTDHEYLEYVCQIRWLICFIRPDLHQEWTKQSNVYSDLLIKAKQRALWKVRAIYKQLKDRIGAQKAEDVEFFKQPMCIIETMFSSNFSLAEHESIKGLYVCKKCGDDIQSHRATVFPSFEQTLLKNLTSLCQVAVDQKKQDLIHDLVVIIKINGIEKVDHMVCGEEVLKPLELEHQLSNSLKMPAWYAWNILCSMESVKLGKYRDLLRKNKNLSYSESEDFLRNANRLELHNIAAQITVIEDGKQTSKNVVGNIYKRNEFDVPLQIILEQVFEGEMEFFDEDVEPIAVQLMIDEDDILYLHVEWPGFKEILYIQQFKGGMDGKTGEKRKNETADFIKNLYAKPGLHYTLNLNYASREKVNAKKHLAKAGIEGILYDLFILEQSGSCVALRAKRVSLENLNKYQLKALKAKIDELTLLPLADHRLQGFMRD